MVIILLFCHFKKNTQASFNLHNNNNNNNNAKKKIDNTQQKYQVQIM